MAGSDSYGGLLESYERQAPPYDRRWRHYREATPRATFEATPWDELRQVLPGAEDGIHHYPDAR